MTSRDGYNQNRPMRGSGQAPRDSQRQELGLGLDPNELDRYMSGQPAKEPRFDPYGRSQSSGRTERVQSQPQVRQQRPQQPQYDDYNDGSFQNEGEWFDDDYGYENSYDYEEYQPEPEQPVERRQQPRRQPRPDARARQFEPEYDDDLYDDPYVLDDDDTVAPRRQQRRNPRSSGRPRQSRPSPSFALPPIIAEAPVVKDRKALGMMGVAFLSALAMILVVMTRRENLDALIFTHVNANGETENLQSAAAIWNLPLIAGMVTLISSVAAWFLARWGEFLPRFLLGGAIGVQFVVWVAVFAYLF